MGKRWWAFAVLLAAASASSGALACSCGNFDRFGFIHAELWRLPANAKGVLFLPRPVNGNYSTGTAMPAGMTAAAFAIKSDKRPGDLPVKLTWLAEAGLVRISPAEGFKPGAVYTIAHVGVKARQFDFPMSVQFGIASAPVPLVKGSTRLVLEGPPVRKLLSLPTAGGSCSTMQPAAAQPFHFERTGVAPELQGAMLYFAQARPNGEPAFSPLEYRGSACARKRHGSTSLGGGKELLHVRCEATLGKVAIRARVGVLEIDDALETIEAEVDFAKASGNCSKGSMLKEAMSSGDRARIKDAVCNFPYENEAEWGAFPAQRRVQARRVYPAMAAQDTPSLAALADLASGDDPSVGICARATIKILLDEAPVIDDADLDRVGRSLKMNIQSCDIDATAQVRDMFRYPHAKTWIPTVAPAKSLKRRERLKDVLGAALVDKLINSDSQRICQRK